MEIGNRLNKETVQLTSDETIVRIHGKRVIVSQPKKPESRLKQMRWKLYLWLTHDKSILAISVAETVLILSLILFNWCLFLLAMEIMKEGG